METEFGSKLYGNNYSQEDHAVAKKLAKGLCGYLERNCTDGGNKRVKIELIGKQLSSGASEVYKTALELFKDYSWCIRVRNDKEAPEIDERDEILRDSTSCIELSSSSDSSEELSSGSISKDEYSQLANMREALRSLSSLESSDSSSDSSSEEEMVEKSKLRNLNEPFKVKFEHDFEQMNIHEFDDRIADKLAKGRIKSEPSIYGVKFRRLEVSQAALEALKRQSENTSVQTGKTKDKVSDIPVQNKLGTSGPQAKQQRKSGRREEGCQIF